MLRALRVAATSPTVTCPDSDTWIPASHLQEGPAEKMEAYVSLQAALRVSAAESRESRANDTPTKIRSKRVVRLLKHCMNTLNKNAL